MAITITPEQTIPHTQSVSNRVAIAAERLKRHIKTTNLKPGDRYLTADDASQLLGENVTTVQRAMALLAKEDYLDRRPKAGTFIGSKVDVTENTRCLHVMLPQECIREQGLQQVLWQYLCGVRQVMPTISVRFDFMPENHVPFARQILNSSDDRMAGVLLVLASSELRAFFNDSAIPTVVLGGVESNLTNLNWITLDQQSIGQELTHYLLNRGHKKIATIMRDIWSIGEHEIHDGVTHALADHGMNAKALVIRSTPTERETTIEMARAILTEDTPATGFICRTTFLADCIQDAAKSLDVQNRIDITICTTVDTASSSPYVCVKPEICETEMGKLIGQMLQRGRPSHDSGPHGHRVPIKLALLTN